MGAGIRGSRFRPIRTPYARHATKMTREEKMSVKKSEAERARAKAAPLARHYRAIGPAAIVAALICARKKPATPVGTKTP